MFGLENSANNFGRSAGLLANTTALRPIEAAEGTIFVDVQTLLIYRYDAIITNSWQQINGNGGTITGAFNGCQEQANQIGLGGNTSQATTIDVSDFELEFVDTLNSTANFRIVGNQGIGEYAFVTSIAATNDGGVYFGNYEDKGTIQSKSLSFQTPTLLYLNKNGGDVVIGSTTTFAINQTAAAFVFTNGVVFYPNGSATIPSIAFTSDTNTGMYRVSANTIGFVCNGVRQGQISSAGLRSSNTLIDTSTSGSFKVGLYTAGIIVSTGSVKLEINGVVYRLLTST